MFTMTSLSLLHATQQLSVYAWLIEHARLTTTVNHLKVPLCILKFVLLPNWHKLQKFLTSDTILNALLKQFGGKIVEFRPYNMVNRLSEKIG